jgi:hypothetical protein
MKKILTVKTRWEYYVSNIAGLIIILALIGWCVFLSFDNGKMEFSAMSFWIGLILTMIVPFAVISFFSSMKSVVVYENQLVISYLFKNHHNQIAFSEVKDVKTTVNKTKTSKGPGSLRSSFALVLHDGRIFEFSRSQFDDYDKLVSTIERHVRK